MAAATEAAGAGDRADEEGLTVPPEDAAAPAESAPSARASTPPPPPPQVEAAHAPPAPTTVGVGDVSTAVHTSSPSLVSDDSDNETFHLPPAARARDHDGAHIPRLLGATDVAASISSGLPISDPLEALLSRKQVMDELRSSLAAAIRSHDAASMRAVLRVADNNAAHCCSTLAADGAHEGSRDSDDSDSDGIVPDAFDLFGWPSRAQSASLRRGGGVASSDAAGDTTTGTPRTREGAARWRRRAVCTKLALLCPDKMPPQLHFGVPVDRAGVFDSPLVAVAATGSVSMMKALLQAVHDVGTRCVSARHVVAARKPGTPSGSSATASAGAGADESLFGEEAVLYALRHCAPGVRVLRAISCHVPDPTNACPLAAAAAACNLPMMRFLVTTYPDACRDVLMDTSLCMHPLSAAMYVSESSLRGRAAALTTVAKVTSCEADDEATAAILRRDDARADVQAASIALLLQHGAQELARVSAHEWATSLPATPLKEPGAIERTEDRLMPPLAAAIDAATPVGVALLLRAGFAPSADHGVDCVSCDASADIVGPLLRTVKRRAVNRQRFCGDKRAGATVSPIRLARWAHQTRPQMWKEDSNTWFVDLRDHPHEPELWRSPTLIDTRAVVDCLEDYLRCSLTARLAVAMWASPKVRAAAAEGGGDDHSAEKLATWTSAARGVVAIVVELLAEPLK